MIVIRSELVICARWGSFHSSQKRARWAQLVLQPNAFVYEPSTVSTSALS